MRLTSLPPIVGDAPRALVLGSMPGAASLAAGQYYAHPRNAFWPLMEALFGVPAARPYPDRVAALAGAGIALWDVLASCTRDGSLDADIRDAAPNPIAAFVAEHPSIRMIALNGGEAARRFDRHVAVPGVTVLRLPSTSPAHARPFAEKLAAWTALGAACA